MTEPRAPRPFAPLWARIMLGAGAWTALVKGISLFSGSEVADDWAAGAAILIGALAIGAIAETAAPRFRPRVWLLHAATLLPPIAAGHLLGGWGGWGAAWRAGTSLGWLGIAATGVLSRALVERGEGARAGERYAVGFLALLATAPLLAVQWLLVPLAVLGAGGGLLEEVFAASAGAVLVVSLDVAGRIGARSRRLREEEAREAEERRAVA